VRPGAVATSADAPDETRLPDVVRLGGSVRSERSRRFIVRPGRIFRFVGSVAASGLLLGGALLSAPGVAASGTTVYVSPSGAAGGADTSCATAAYATINEAVSAAAVGSTVVACAGTYKEDVALSKALTLTTSGTVTIDATGLDNGIKITASNVTVAGFTVENATGEGILAQQPNPVPGPPIPGTHLFSGLPLTHVVIKHNVVENNDLGGLTPATTTYSECQASGPIPGDCGEGIHLWSVAYSQVLLNTITGNSGGVLLTDEFGPTHGNLIAGNVVTDNPYDCGITLASHNLGRSPTTGALMPRFGGVYGNVVRNNVVLDNGIKGQGAGVGMFAPAPGTASYDNVIEANMIAGNGLAGVALHAHAPGAFVGGNQILDNLIGRNNVDGDPDTTPPDMATTGILAWSAATPITVTIAGNTIFDNWYGIWLGHVVNAPGASYRNTFWAVSTHVHRA